MKDKLKCSVCATSDINLIRICLLYKVVPECAGNKIARDYRKKKSDTTKLPLWAEDGE